MFFSSIKEINRYIKHLLLKKLTFSKLRFYRKENLKRCTTLEEQEGTRYIRETFGIALLSSAIFRLRKLCLRFLLLIGLDWEIKGFYQSSVGNEVDFTDIMNASPNILTKNWNFKKLRNGFVDKRTMITTALTSSCHSKTLVPFCLWKKVPENTFLTLTVNYCKIVQKNKLCYSKQH